MGLPRAGDSTTFCVVQTSRKREKKKRTDSVLFKDWYDEISVMTCKYASVNPDRSGSMVFYINAQGGKQQTGETKEWEHLNWSGQRALCTYNGKCFTVRLKSEAHANIMKDLQFLNGDNKKCLLCQDPDGAGFRAPGADSVAAAYGMSAAGGRTESKLPTYTFKETAEQIEKDKLIFAKMGIESARLAFDGLLKAEFGYRDGPGHCESMGDVLRQVLELVQAGEITFTRGQDVAQRLGVADAAWRRPDQEEYLYLQFRVAGKPKEEKVPRNPPEDCKVFVGTRKLVPAVRLTCADFVDRLIRLPSSSWTDNFLLTMPYHSTPSWVLKLLLQRTYPAVESKWRPRVFAILKKWVQKYTSDFINAMELKKLLKESEKLPSLTPEDKDFHKRERRRLTKGIKARLRVLATEQSAETRFYMWPRLLDDPTQYDAYAGDIFTLVGGPAAMTKELTLVAQDRLQSLNGRDFVKKGYEETPRNQMKISDHVSRWVATTVLLQAEEKARVATMCAWLDVAQECREKKNFNTVFEVMAGLQQTPVYRLNILHKRAPGHKISKYMQRFETLKELVASNGNYKMYRGELTECRGRPCVPYFGVLLKDLFYYEEAKPKVKITFEDGTTWIDVEKCNRMGQLVNDALLFKGNRYDGEHDVGNLRSVENSMRATRNEDALYSLSYKYKPRGGG